jgi:hypothetical protein
MITAIARAAMMITAIARAAMMIMATARAATRIERNGLSSAVNGAQMNDMPSFIHAAGGAATHCVAVDATTQCGANSDLASSARKMHLVKKPDMTRNRAAVVPRNHDGLM